MKSKFIMNFVMPEDSLIFKHLNHTYAIAAINVATPYSVTNKIGLFEQIENGQWFNVFTAAEYADGNGSLAKAIEEKGGMANFIAFIIQKINEWLRSVFSNGPTPSSEISINAAPVLPEVTVVDTSVIVEVKTKTPEETSVVENTVVSPIEIKTPSVPGTFLISDAIIDVPNVTPIKQNEDTVAIAYPVSVNIPTVVISDESTTNKDSQLLDEMNFLFMKLSVNVDSTGVPVIS